MVLKRWFFTFRRLDVAFFVHRREWIASLGCVGAIEGRFGGVCGDDPVTTGGWISVAHQRECVDRMGDVARWQSIGRPTEIMH